MANRSFAYIQGVTNYDKLKTLSKNTKVNNFHKFNPFTPQQKHEKIKNNIETSPIDDMYLDQDIYAQLSYMNGHTNNFRNQNKAKSFYNLDAKTRRSRLMRMSSHDQLDEVLTKLTDEVIVNGQNKLEVSLDIDTIKLETLGLSEKAIEKIIDKAEDAFNWVYSMYGFNEQGSKKSLWNKAYLFLIEGEQAYEIVYDNINNPTKIIAIHEIDALDLQEHYINGVKFWRYHKKSINGKEEYVILYDSQITKISWSEATPNNRLSYLEQLLRTYNNVRIMDEATLIWQVTNSVFRMIFTVPTKGKSRTNAAMSLVTEKNRYKDDIQYDSDTGELFVNGGPKQSFSKEYWMADGDSGKPEVDTVGGDGPEMTTENNEYYNRKFYRAARIPYSRFDANSSESWNADARSQIREEISFGRFVDRIRDILKMLLLRPMYMQLVLDMPELKDDSTILKAINIKFNSYSIFEELMHMDIMQEKMEALNNLREFGVTQTPEGDEVHFFSIEFLIKEYFNEITDDKLKLNEKMMKKERKKLFKYQEELNDLRTKLEEEGFKDDEEDTDDSVIPIKNRKPGEDSEDSEDETDPGGDIDLDLSDDLDKPNILNSNYEE